MPISIIIITYFVVLMANYTMNIITLNQKQKELQNELNLLKENEILLLFQESRMEVKGS